MKTLFILRHAKSSWDNADLADFDRPLNQRGKAAAPFMGETMARESFVPEIILSSPAVRARETARLVKDAAHMSAEIVHVQEIYEASSQTLRQIIAGIEDRFGSALIVGHNPGMEGLVRLLTGESERMPTAALAVIGLDITNWSEISSARGKLHRVILPKEEMKVGGRGNR